MDATYVHGRAPRSCRSMTSTSSRSSTLSGGGSVVAPYREKTGRPVRASRPFARFVWSSVPRMPCSGENSAVSLGAATSSVIRAPAWYRRSMSLWPCSSIPVWLVSRPTRLPAISVMLSVRRTDIPGRTCPLLRAPPASASGVAAPLTQASTSTSMQHPCRSHSMTLEHTLAAPRPRVLPATLLLLGMAACASAQQRAGGGAAMTVSPVSSVRAAVADSVAGVLQRGLADSAYPGAYAIVGDSDAILASRGVGHLDWAPSPTPDEDTLWDLASL